MYFIFLGVRIWVPMPVYQHEILLNMSLMLHISNSLKDMNRKVNYDLRRSVKWLRANRIKKNLFFLDLKTENNKNMNLRISGQKYNIICKTKCLGVILNEHLTFKCHLENLKLKLKKRANCLLSKIRYFVKFR